MSTRDDMGSAGRSLAGYDYQIEVSVWLALDLVLASRLAAELVLEPVGEEDIEAEIDVSPSGSGGGDTAQGGYRLVVQAKLREGDAWTVRDFAALLRHGKARRPAADRLADGRVRYLLVTSAALNGRTRGLRVRRPGSWPDPVGMPASLEGFLPDGAAGRVGIIGGEDRERLDADISRLLGEAFHVPRSRWNECRAALWAEARARVRGAAGGRWTRDDLARTIRRHGGCLAGSPELDRYVEPTNWGDMLSAMRTRNAILIVGQSGTGKTTSALRLYEEMRREIPGLSRVLITNGHAQLRADATEPPVLFEIEDPWGRYDFDTQNRTWNEQLPRILMDARPDRLVVVTSRLDVAQASGALASVERWAVPLEIDHYGDAERRGIYRLGIPALPRVLRSLAKDAEGKALSVLSTPLEIRGFHGALTLHLDEFDGPCEELVSKAIEVAHGSLEQAVMDQVDHRRGTRVAAVLWGMLKALDRFPVPLLRRIEDDLAGRDEDYGNGIWPLVTLFVGARYLRLSDGMVAYHHPRVEAGILASLRRVPVKARKALADLAEAFMALDRDGGSRGTIALARLIRATGRHPELEPSFPTSVRSAVDAWLTTALVDGGRDFEGVLGLAALVGTERCNAAEAARFLINMSDYAPGGFSIWLPPVRDDAWRSRMRADPEVATIVGNFVRIVLPRSDEAYGADFAIEAERMAPGLGPTFLAGVRNVVGLDSLHPHDALVEGALGDLDAFEAVVDDAARVLRQDNEEEVRRAEIALAIENVEYGEDETRDLEYDGLWVTRGFVSAYVRRVRAVGAWDRLAHHRHGDLVRGTWLDELIEDGDPRPEEVVAAFALGLGTSDEGRAWRLSNRHWDPSHGPALLARIVEGHTNAWVRRDALVDMVRHARDAFGPVWDILARRDNPSRMAEIGIELGGLGLEGGDRTTLARVLEGAPPAVADIARAATLMRCGQEPRLADEGLCLLLRCDPGDPVSAFRMRMAEHAPTFTERDVGWILAHATVPEDASEALGMAVRHGMDGVIEAALGHRFSIVVAGALRAVAARIPDPLPDRLLSLAGHKGSPVRKALVDIIDERPHPGHLSALSALAEDTWLARSLIVEGHRFTIARAAIAAAAKLERIDPCAAERLHRLASDTPDLELALSTLGVLVRSADMRFRVRILEMAMEAGAHGNRGELAAMALLQNHDRVEAAVARRIGPTTLGTVTEAVAVQLLVLASARADMDHVVRMAHDLSTNLERRVFLLLVLRVILYADAETASRIAEMLPHGHPGVRWVSARDAVPHDLDEAMLDDLGEPASVREVVALLRRLN